MLCRRAPKSVPKIVQRKQKQLLPVQMKLNIKTKNRCQRPSESFFHNKVIFFENLILFSEITHETANALKQKTPVLSQWI